MSEKKNKDLNELIVTLFNSIVQSQSVALDAQKADDLTENDLHIIENIGIESGQKTSVIAKKIGVTPATMTINLNSLEKKGYILRKRSEKDKRVVNVALTEKGKKAFFTNVDFHKSLLREALKRITDDERNNLVICLNKVNSFFEEYFA